MLEKDIFKEGDNHLSSSKTITDKRAVLFSTNELDNYLINSYLKKESGWALYDVDELLTLFKLLSYLKVDLIILDLAQNSQKSLEILKKLQQSQISKEIPKLVLLDSDLKFDANIFIGDGIEYVRKPLVKEIFLHRIDALMKSSNTLFHASHFFNRSKKLIDEAIESVSIYQKLFLHDETITAIFDPYSGELTEANLAFEKLFGRVSLVNKLLKSQRAIKRFIPKVETINYLNHYERSKWAELLSSNIEFNYSLKVEIGFKSYSFHLLSKPIVIMGKRYIAIKFINILDLIPNKAKKESTLTLKEDNLSSFKEEFLKLRDILTDQNFANCSSVKDLLYKLSTKLSILCEDAEIVKSMEFKSDKNDLIQLLSAYLQKNYHYAQIKINGRRLGEEIGGQEIVTSIDKQTIEAVVSDLLNSNSFDIKRNELEFYIYQKDRKIYIEIASELVGDDFEDDLSFKLYERAKEIGASLKPVYDKQSNRLVYLITINA